MLVGIMSDSHDRFETMRSAIERLQARGCEFFIHCGDIGSAQMVDLLAGLNSVFVFGNTDWERQSLRKAADSLNVKCLDSGGVVELDGKSIYVLHGDDAGLKERVISSQQYDYVLQGHTHEMNDSKRGKTRIINPGALHRAARHTAAILDLKNDRLEWIDAD